MGEEELSAAAVLYHLIKNFFGVALIEEGLKFAGVWLLTSKHKNYNSQFDGVVYCVYISLGFAAAENLIYVVTTGFGTGLIRAVTAVPAHMFFGVFMGYFYSKWHIRAQARAIEGELRGRGYLTSGASGAFRTAPPVALAFTVPVLIHGSYDFLLSLPLNYSEVIFIVLLVALYIVCFTLVRVFSKKDVYSGGRAMQMTQRQYPEAYARLAAEHPEEIARAQKMGGVAAPCNLPPEPAPQPQRTWEQQYARQQQQYPQYRQTPYGWQQQYPPYGQPQYPPYGQPQYGGYPQYGQPQPYGAPQPYGSPRPYVQPSQPYGAPQNHVQPSQYYGQPSQPYGTPRPYVQPPQNIQPPRDERPSQDERPAQDE
jgi:hypothetical protein